MLCNYILRKQGVELRTPVWGESITSHVFEASLIRSFIYSLSGCWPVQALKHLDTISHVLQLPNISFHLQREPLKSILFQKRCLWRRTRREEHSVHRPSWSVVPTPHSITILDRSREGWQVVFGINVLSQDSTHPICGRRGRTWAWGEEEEEEEKLGEGWWRGRATVGERKRDRGREGEGVDRIRMKMQGDVCAGGVCARMWVCVCVWARFKARQSVTPRVRISRHDSPPDRHTWTHSLPFYFRLRIRMQKPGGLQKCPLLTVLTHVQQPDNLKRLCGGRTESFSSRQCLGESEGRKERKKKSEGEWAEEKKKSWH